MKYQLVLQWAVHSIEDYDAIIELEKALTEAMPKGSELDGHDAGSGEMNIFIHTNVPEKVFNELKAVLTERSMLTSVRAAFRDFSEEAYTVLWPKELTSFDVK